MDTYTIKEIEEKLQSIKSVDDPFFIRCKNDSRKGVQLLVKKWEKNFQKSLELNKQFENMMIFEKSLKQKGFQRIAGVDEVGRGPLAGPVVAASVILPDDFYLPGINDSKKLTEAKREQLYEDIVKNCVSYGIGIVQAEEIDVLNIYQATKKAMVHAVHALCMKPDYLLIDALEIDVPFPQESIIKGDAKSVSIAAASIVAKVTRDRLMVEYSKKYPEYGFEKNAGYGTKEHLEAIRRYGPTPIHRKSFSPIKEMIDL
jgi:ribonuclease HII